MRLDSQLKFGRRGLEAVVFFVRLSPCAAGQVPPFKEQLDHQVIASIRFILIHSSYQVSFSRDATMQTKTEYAEMQPAKNSGAHSALRRSKRVILDVPLVIRGKREDQCPFREETFTITINAHGGLLVLENRVALGQKIVLMNPKNWDEREATIAFLGPPYAGLATVGVEFARPAPEFWALSAPPADWSRS